jgi:hypothetical protein
MIFTCLLRATLSRQIVEIPVITDVVEDSGNGGVRWRQVEEGRSRLLKRLTPTTDINEPTPSRDIFVRDRHGKEIGDRVGEELRMFFCGGAEATEALPLARLDSPCSSRQKEN